MNGNSAVSGAGQRRWTSPGLTRPGFLCDPGKVVGVPVCDRPCRDTGYLVGVLPLCSGNDLGNPAAAGMQRHPALAALVNFAPPSVDRLDGREVVRAGA